MGEPTKRMLVALAHPDDESFGMAGTITRYVNEGVQVYLICATDGDLGTVDEEFVGQWQTTAQVRMAELCCAAEALGLSHVYTLGYRDSGMAGSPENKHPSALAAADPDEVTCRITEIIREVRPQVVVTHDPYGGYGHPDHIAMYGATTRAFHAASDPQQYPQQVEGGLGPYSPQKLYYSTFPRTGAKVAVALMPLFGQDPAHMGRNKDMDFREVAAHSYPIHARIDTRAYADQAERARACHASQMWTPPGNRGFWQRMRRAFTAAYTDTFMRAYPEVNGSRVRERDLFNGVTPD